MDSPSDHSTRASAVPSSSGKATGPGRNESSPSSAAPRPDPARAERDRRQGRIGARADGGGRPGAPTLQRVAEPAEAAQGIEATAHVATVPLQQAGDDLVQERTLFRAQGGQVNAAGPLQESQVHGQGLEKQLAIGAIPLHGSSLSFGRM